MSTDVEAAMTNLADTIRDKTGTSDTLTISEMAGAVATIGSSGSSGMPDYSAGVSVAEPLQASPFIAPTNGYLLVSADWTEATSVVINGNDLHLNIIDSAGGEVSFPYTILLSEGDVIYFTTTAYTNTYSGTFVPLKGAN